MPAFAEVQAEAKKRWDALTAGDRPWIRISTAICGEAAGALATVHAFQSATEAKGIQATISEVGCFGPCFAEPLVSVKTPGGPWVFYQRVTEDKVSRIIEQHLVAGKPVPELAFGYNPEEGVPIPQGIPNLWDHPMMKPQVRIAMRNAGVIDPTDIHQYVARGGFEGLNRALTALKPDQVVEEVTKSGLRGRGGAAFPTGTKWSFLSRARAPVKYLLCNCEEGDPGAFNDKTILESDPFSLLEGMVIGASARGCTQGYVFIRYGHDGPIRRTWAAIDAMRAQGFLGKNIMGSGFNFDIEVALTGDSYVAGEETALMEAIEGKRAWPRFRPPFPANAGLFQKPSNINNVKTLSYVPEIIRRGGDWYAGIGVDRSKGTVIACFTGGVKYTGLAELPLGLNLRKVVDEVAGGVTSRRRLKMLQTGGPLGGVISADRIDITLDFDVMQRVGAMFGSGGIIVGDDTTCPIDLIRNLVAFCQFESCGKCFPCRTGMGQLLQVLDRIATMQGRPGDLELMQMVGTNMQAGSLCGHGQLGFNPVSSGLRYFANEFDAHISQKRCPSGACYRSTVYPTRTRSYQGSA